MQYWHPVFDMATLVFTAFLTFSFGNPILLWKTPQQFLFFCFLTLTEIVSFSEGFFFHSTVPNDVFSHGFSFIGTRKTWCWYNSCFQLLFSDYSHHHYSTTSLLKCKASAYHLHLIFVTIVYWIGRLALTFSPQFSSLCNCIRGILCQCLFYFLTSAFSSSK